MSVVAKASWGIAYLCVMCAVVGSLFYLRGRSDALQRQDEWDAWRESELHGGDHDGPVQRRQPKSQRPPMTALLEDHFATCVAGAVLFGSALFVTFGFMTQGVVTGSRTVIHEDPGEGGPEVVGPGEAGNESPRP